MEKKSISVCLLGLGKLGSQLALELLKKEISVRAFYNRSFTNPKKVDRSIQPLFHQMDEIPLDADVYILSVSDDALREVAFNLPQKIKSHKIVAHTSGVHTMDVFDTSIKRPGVFYPLNTFAKGQTINWEETPFYLSGSSKQTLETLTSLAKKISRKVFSISDTQKRILHVSAVIVNNFPTHLFQLANALLEKNNLNFDHLLPLIQTMVANAKTKELDQILTGPAIRGDQETINKHLELLENTPELKEIYQKLTKSINKDIDV